MKKVKLVIIGLSYSQTRSGAYALIMGEEDGQRRLPIIIGSNEAQAIAIRLEGLNPHRPLTHDLFLSVTSAFNIELIEINIIRLNDGIFYSELICRRNKTRIKIDARTSDAVALAIRFKCPIYVDEDIMKKAAVYLDEKTGKILQPEEVEKERKITDFSTDELNEMMETAIEKEDYERASEIRDELKNRKEKGN